MKAPANQPASGGLSVQDVLFVLFRHKWKIVFLTLSGLAAAAAVYFTREPAYQSTSKLLVRYVLERSTVDPFEAQTNPGGRAADYVINAEREIITSNDLAIGVARMLGPERLLPGAGQAATPEQAASVVLAGLEAAAPTGSNVIRVTYQNPDPKLAVDVLGELIQQYFVRHLEIHRSTDTFEYVAKQAEMARSRLRQAEDEANKFKLEAGIMDIGETMASLEKRRTEVQVALEANDAVIVEQRAKLEAMRAVAAKRGVTAAEEKAAGPGTEDVFAVLKESSLASSEYQALADRLEFLRQSRNQLLARYTPSSRAVQAVDRQIEEVRKQGLALLEAHPELIVKKAGATDDGGLAGENARLAALTAKAGKLQSQAEAIAKEVERVQNAGVKLAALERKRQLEEQKYTYLESSLEKARVDVALDPSKVPNISVVQQPSAPVRVVDGKILKLVAALAGSGLALGVGLAFLIEKVLDRRIRRPVEISARLQLPLLISIPHFRLRGGPAGLLTLDPATGDGAAGGGAIIVPPDPRGHRPPARSARGDAAVLDPYTKAIRDRIIFNFAVNNVLHRPKLVALTGLSGGAGTSTIAAGVARAFVQNDGMKVLLVDLNPPAEGGPGPGGAGGRHTLSGALQLAHDQTRSPGTQNLFFASATTRANGHQPATLEPQQLYQLIPKLQESDFDYIIFDMPPVDPTSPTLAMAGFMDKVLLVLDAEHTSPEQLQWGYSELARGKADVSCVFNKARSTVPRWVDGGV